MPTRAHDVRHRIHAAAIALLACCSLILGLAPAASAHAQLVKTTPIADTTVEPGAVRIEMRFNERISVLPGAIRAFSPDGKTVAATDVSTRDGTVTYSVDADATGTWAVAWRILSADTHPVSGVLVFHAGEPTGSGAAAARARESTESDAVVSVAATTLSGIAMALLLLGAGALTARLAWFGGSIRGLGLTAAAGSVVVIAAYVLSVAEAAGVGIGETLDSGALRDQVGDTLGWSAIGMLAGFMSLLVAMFMPERLRTVRIGLAAIAPAGLTAGSHAMVAEPGWLRIPLDVLHSIAAGLWIGGLVAVAIALRTADQKRVIAGMPRFSRMAFVCVVVLVSSGVVVGLMETGSVEAVTGTAWGRLVATKLGLLMLAMPLAYRNRKAVAALPSEPVAAIGSLRRYVRFEMVLLAGVLAATAWLVSEPPAQTALDPGFREATEQLDAGGSVQLLLDPARAGANVIHLYSLAESGMPDDRYPDASIRASNDELGIENLHLEVRRRGPGHWTADNAIIPQAGDWKFRIDLRRGDFDVAATVVTLEVAPAA